MFSLQFSVNFFLLLLSITNILINKQNILMTLMSIELMLLAINLLFIVFSALLDNIVGQIFALYVLTIAAAESAIGLAIFIIYFKEKQTIFLDGFIRARG